MLVWPGVAGLSLATYFLFLDCGIRSLNKPGKAAPDII
jgi:hypothetical protein